MHHPKKRTMLKAQSAMEYLMTYGWAILIVAVVLGALFSLGVFNSSSFIPVGCIAESGYYCQGGTLTTNGVISVTIGQATGAQMNNVSIYFVPESGSLSDGAVGVDIGTLQNLQKQTVDIQLPKSAPYPSSYAIGTPLVGTLYITYTDYYGVKQTEQIATLSLKASTNIAISTTTINPYSPSIPSGILYYVPINVTNTQSTATPPDFQQMINITESAYSSYIS
ncbi:MAG: hypothetical protein ACP5SJ_03580, partial [Candidatus Micrarchaeia archaeon]